MTPSTKLRQGSVSAPPKCKECGKRADMVLYEDGFTKDIIGGITPFVLKYVQRDVLYCRTHGLGIRYAK